MTAYRATGIVSGLLAIICLVVVFRIPDHGALAYAEAALPWTLGTFGFALLAAWCFAELAQLRRRPPRLVHVPSRCSTCFDRREREKRWRRRAHMR